MKAVLQRSRKPASPTPGPWSFEDEDIVYRHWQYTGWPNFGRIVVASVGHSWPQDEERRANAALIIAAVNQCFAVNPKHPLSVARAYGNIVTACQNVVALEMSDAGRDPVVHEVINLVSNALEQARREA